MQTGVGVAGSDRRHVVERHTGRVDAERADRDRGMRPVEAAADPDEHRRGIDVQRQDVDARQQTGRAGRGRELHPAGRRSDPGTQRNRERRRHIQGRSARKREPEPADISPIDRRRAAARLVDRDMGVGDVDLQRRVEADQRYRPAIHLEARVPRRTGRHRADRQAGAGDRHARRIGSNCDRVVVRAGERPADTDEDAETRDGQLQRMPAGERAGRNVDLCQRERAGRDDQARPNVDAERAGRVEDRNGEVDRRRADDRRAGAERRVPVQLECADVVGARVIRAACLVQLNGDPGAVGGKSVDARQLRAREAGLQRDPIAGVVGER